MSPERIGEVGRAVPRLEGAAKVTGRAEYIHHVERPGMLHGVLARSTEVHADLVAVDTAAAIALAGVTAVVTAADAQRFMPDLRHGPAFWDQPVLAIDRVRYEGEPIALVLADDRSIADDAAGMVRGTYRPLPRVLDEVDAATAGPFVHERLQPAGTFPDLKHLEAAEGTNVMMDAKVRRGDPATALATAAHVFEHTFRTQPCAQVPLEPPVALAELLGDTLVVHSSTQNPSYVRMELARLLGWPENRVRVRTAFLGGGFGAKLYLKLEALAALGALLTGRPVKVALPMNEQFVTINRQGSTMRLRTGVAEDGTIVASEIDVWWNNGAYADIGPRVAHKAALVASGPYAVEHLRIDSRAVYTNRPPAGAMRGFGIPQVAFGYECQADIIAATLGLDPIAYREQNLLRNGQPQATGTVLRASGVAEVLARLKVEMRWDEPRADAEPDAGARRGIRHGRGVAIALKACLAPTTSVATVLLYGDGSAAVSTSTVDMGQGSDTALAQLAADTLGLRAAAVRVIHPDTDVTPYDMGTIGSRSTFHMGNAVVAAAQAVGDQLRAFVASQWTCAPDDLSLRDGSVVHADGRSITFADAMRADFGMEAGTLVGTGSYTPETGPEDPATGQSDAITPFWMAGGTGIELEVDTETGRITVTRMVNVADGGALVNPAIAERQITGAAILQLGNTLAEELRFEDGSLVNGTLRDYKIPALLDIPRDITTVFVDVPHPDGPSGAKGLGETGTFGVSAAVANAVADATGVRITELPLNPERVLRALRADAGTPIAPAGTQP